MSSPFSTIEEFNNAIDGPTEGAIYTFANTPIVNTLALLAAVCLFVWFIVKAYSPHHHVSSVDKSLNHLSTFIVVSMLSLVAADHRQVTPAERIAQRDAQQERPQSRLAQVARQAPEGLMGLMGLASVGLSPLRKGRAKKRKRQSRASRSFRRY
ncbi:MAG: hypothetical protein WBD47_01945 [Phormidesmis sp.]